jgi:hypothetical protein
MKNFKLKISNFNISETEPMSLQVYHVGNDGRNLNKFNQRLHIKQGNKRYQCNQVLQTKCA